MSAIPAAIVPILQTYANDIKPAIVVMMLSTGLGAMLLPLLIVLFGFSKPQSRRTPVFFFVFLSIIFGLIDAVWMNIVTIRGILSPTHPNTSVANVVGLGIATGLPMFAIDVVLLLRLFAVFPASRTPIWKLVLVVGPPVGLKLVHVGSWVMFSYYSAVEGSETLFSLGDRHHVEWFVISCAANLLDNTYASVLFLTKLRGTMSARIRLGKLFNDSWTARVRTMFWLAAMSFVLPVLLSAAQIVLIAMRPMSTLYLYVTIANAFVTVICAVFATVWSTNRLTSLSPTLHGGSPSTLRFVTPSRPVTWGHAPAAAPQVEMPVALAKSWSPWPTDSYAESSVPRLALPVPRAKVWSPWPTEPHVHDLDGVSDAHAVMTEWPTAPHVHDLDGMSDVHGVMSDATCVV